MKLVALSLALCVTLIFASCSHDFTIKIGAGFSLTGSQAPLGLPASRGATLAAKEINENGGVLGKNIELIVRDNKHDSAMTEDNARQFVENDKVTAVIGSTDSDSALALAPTVQQAGLPFITVGATSPKLPEQIGDMIFLACFGDNTQAAAGAEHAYKNFGGKAYMAYDNSGEYTRLLAGYFKTRFTELGGIIVYEEGYGEGTTDFSTMISAAKTLATQPDFYFIAAMPETAPTAVTQFRQAGISAPIMGGDSYDEQEIISQTGGNSENVYFTTHALMDVSNGTDAVKKFMEAYRKEYGAYPDTSFAALGYDTVKLLANAISRAGSTKPKAIKSALESTKNFSGVTGYITFSADSHVPVKDVAVILVKNGAFTLAAQFSPEKTPAP